MRAGRAATSIRSGVTWIAKLLLVVVSLVEKTVDLVAEPVARLMLRGASPGLRWGMVLALLTASVAGVVLVPRPWWLPIAIVGLLILVSVFREWQKGETLRDRILDRHTDENPDAVPDHLALNAIAALYIIPLFAAVFLRLHEWTGGFSNDPSPLEFVRLSFDNLIDVVTLDVGGALNLNMATTAAEAPWAKAAVVIQKALLAAMFLGAASSLVRSRQAADDSIKVLDTYPDIVLRLGSRGLDRLRQRLADPPPDPPKTDNLALLRTSAAYALLTETLASGSPPGSTTATWIATRLRDRNLMDKVAGRLKAYGDFFDIQDKDFQFDDEYRADMDRVGARRLRLKTGRFGVHPTSNPPSAEEIYHDDDVRDVCESLRYMAAMHEPTPWTDDVWVPINIFLKCNSPAIRSAAATYARNYATYATEAAPMAGHLLAALAVENNREAMLAQLHALRPFAVRDADAIATVWPLLDTDDRDIRRAAAAVLVASNDPAAIGADRLKRMAESPDPYVQKSSAYLLYGACEAGGTLGVDLLDHADPLVRIAARNQVRGTESVAAAQKLARALLADPDDAADRRHLLLAAIPENSRNARLMALVGRIIETHPRPVAAEYGVYCAMKMKAASLAETIRRRIERERSAGSLDRSFLIAAADAAGSFGDAEAIPFLEWLSQSDDDFLVETAQRNLAQLRSVPDQEN